MPKSKNPARKPAPKRSVRRPQTNPKHARDDAQSLLRKPPGRHIGGRPPRFPGRTGGR